MLPKSQRLNLSKSFKFVQAGKRVETPSLKVMFKSGENETALVGVALTKKAFKLATERNRVKRLVSTAIQSLYPSLRKNLNLVIMPKAQALERSVDQLKGELENVKDLYQAD